MEAKKIVAYIDMVGDLFHLGHVEIIKRAKSMCDYLIVGIHSDETVESYKRRPICNMQERIAVVETCKYVDEVVHDSPLQLTKEFVNKYNIDLIIHGDDISHESIELMYSEVKSKLKLIPYTEGISTTNILHRMHTQKYVNLKSKEFRKLLSSTVNPSILMEAHSGLSSKIVENAGFKGIWASGLSISASLCLRDANEASWTQVTSVVEYMNNATNLPILLDGDTGYGNFNNARILVKTLDKMGIAGVCIEDKVFPKTNSFIDGNQDLANIDEFCGKIRACKDSQISKDFVVVARIEAFISGAGLNEALKRANAYENAGADAILVHSKQTTPTEIVSFMNEWNKKDKKIPVIIVPTTYFTSYEDLAKLGISLIIFANHNVRASISAMENVCEKIFSTKSINNLSNISTVKHIFSLQNEEELSEAEKKYLP
jgi:phosphoenolpyruvate phosphomutase